MTLQEKLRAELLSKKNELVEKRNQLLAQVNKLDRELVILQGQLKEVCLVAGHNYKQISTRYWDCADCGHGASGQHFSKPDKFHR